MSKYTREQVKEMLKKRKNFEGEDFSGIDLSGINFSGVEFWRRNFPVEEIPINLSKANLNGTNLSGANLCGAYLVETNLKGANLQKANLSTAQLTAADLTKADLSKAELWSADLNWTNISESFLHQTKLGGAELVGADLCKTMLIEAILEQADLYKAKLVQASLSDANLIATNFQEADLRFANLSKADLANANFYGANLSGADLRRAIFVSADLSDTDLTGVNFGSADLEKADLTNADISGANIHYIKTDGWQIDDIKCTHIYQCEAKFWYVGMHFRKREKSRRDFAPGEFEELFKYMPTLEMVFNGGLSPLNYIKLVGITKIICQQKPEMDLKMKSMENFGLDTILRFTTQRDEDLEEALRLIVKLSMEREQDQKLLSIIKEDFEIPLKSKPSKQIFPTFVIANKVFLKKINGEVTTMGDINIDKIEAKNSALAIGVGSVAKYNTNRVKIDKLLSKLRSELHKNNKDLADSLVKAFKKKDQNKISTIWDKIKEGVDTSSKTYSLLEKLAKLLALPL